MSLETEHKKRSPYETQEAGVEARESKESQEDKELQAAAAMERVELISREVKQSKKQMQNILLHIQEVLSAIRELRKRMALPPGKEGDITSIQHDQANADALKKKIAGLQNEILAMKDELIEEQYNELKEQRPNELPEVHRKEAAGMVESMLNEILQSE